MSGRDIAFPTKSTVSLKEQLVRTTLRNVRSQGHPYVDLREDGKKLIFYCTLCLAPCYGDSSLFDHLKGNLHSERRATAQATLMKSNPWPFSDGVFFFHPEPKEQLKCLPTSESDRAKLLDTHRVDAESLAIVTYNKDSGTNAMENVESDEIPCDSNHELVVPDVLQKGEVSDLVVRHIGVGRIGATFNQKDGACNNIRRIWCEWLGNKGLANEEEGIDVVPEHEFAVVTFPYNYNLGRKGLLDCFRYLLPSSSPHSEAEDNSGTGCKKRKSFSDPEDVSEASTNLGDSSGEDSLSPNNSNSKMLLSANDDQLVLSRILSSKTMRKQLRNQQRVASERLCDICQQKMLPDKDVAALLNRSTGKLVCSSRNSTGAFHLFHASCLIHWILLCEVEIYAKQSVEPDVKRKSRKRVKGKSGGNWKKPVMQEKRVHSLFCPQCQGTGISIDGEELEKPIVPLSQVFKYKIKLLDAHKAWMKSPEVLQNCSMGFHFPLQSDEPCQENVSSLKLLHFYRAVRASG